MTKDILRKHSHVSSFGAIQRECEETITRLQDKLQNEVDSPVRCWVIPRQLMCLVACALPNAGVMTKIDCSCGIVAIASSPFLA